MSALNDLLDSQAADGVRLFVRTLGDEYVLIEGDTKSLEFLGRILLTQAQEPSDCSFRIHPGNPGSVYFDEGSPLGLLIHRLPCEHGRRIAGEEARPATPGE